MLPAYILAHNEPPLAQLPTLTVNAKGRVYPSKALLRKLNLRAGQPIDLLPPTTAVSYWHLDLRPSAARRITWHASTRPRIETIKLPPGLVPPGQLLILALLPSEDSAPGLYQLLPAAPPIPYPQPPFLQQLPMSHSQATSPPLPTLSITDERRAFLHSALVTQLHLTSGHPADLVPPSKHSPYWHLDLRPQAKRVLSVSNGRTYRLTGLQLPTGLLNPDEPPLTLYLLPGEPALPGYYPLLPAPAFVQAYTAFLEQAAQVARRGEALP